MRTLDTVVLIAYFAAMLALGLWFSRKSKGEIDYFTAERSIPWWAVLISIVATETSALTLISVPGLAYKGDWKFLQITFGYILGRVVIGYVLVPLYFSEELVTAYQLLEERFGLAARRVSSVTFLLTRGIADSVRLFATAIPVALIARAFIGEEYAVPAAILVISFAALVYTYAGGMRAVIWTDVLGTSIYAVAAVLALYLIGGGVEGGWPVILSKAFAASKLTVFELPFSFSSPGNFWAALIGGAFLTIGTHGVDQTIVQRLLAAPDEKHARFAIIGSGVAIILLFAVFLLIGTGLFYFYHERVFHISDQVFPTFVVENMPDGLLGLTLSAIFAATMGVHSGALNSLAAATTHDIVLPVTGWKKDDPHVLRLGKLLTLAWAVVLTGGALMFRSKDTPAVTVALSVASLTFGSLVGAFFVGIYSKRVRQRDVITGMLTSVVLMAVAQVLKWPIAWEWFVALGTVITVMVSLAVSRSGRFFQGA